MQEAEIKTLMHTTINIFLSVCCNNKTFLCSQAYCLNEITSIRNIYTLCSIELGCASINSASVQQNFLVNKSTFSSSSFPSTLTISSSFPSFPCSCSCSSCSSCSCCCSSSCSFSALLFSLLLVHNAQNIFFEVLK